MWILQFCCRVTTFKREEFIRLAVQYRSSLLLYDDYAYHKVNPISPRREPFLTTTRSDLIEEKKADELVARLD